MPEDAVQCGRYAYAREHSDFHDVHSLNQGCQGQNKNFLDRVWYNPDFSLSYADYVAFAALKKAVWTGLGTEIRLTAKFQIAILKLL